MAGAKHPQAQLDLDGEGALANRCWLESGIGSLAILAEAWTIKFQS